MLKTEVPNFIANKLMADDAVGAAELINDSVGNAAPPPKP